MQYAESNPSCPVNLEHGNRYIYFLIYYRNHIHHYSVDESTRSHRKIHSTHSNQHGQKGGSPFSRRPKTNPISTYSRSNESNSKYPHISALNDQTLSNSTDESRLFFDSFSSTSTSKQEDNISTSSLPSTPTAAIHNSKVKDWNAMPAPSVTNCDLSTHYLRDQHHLISSGSSSTSSVSKEETRSASGSCHKQRKRKERRDSLSDEHDKKLSRSSGSIIDDLSLSLPLKSTNSNVLMKNILCNKRKQLNHCPRISEISSFKSYSNGSSFDEDSTKKQLESLISVDSYEECQFSDTVDDHQLSHHHILHEQNHDHASGGCSDINSSLADKRNQDDHESVKDTTKHHVRNDSLKENNLESPKETKQTLTSFCSKISKTVASKLAEYKLNPDKQDDCTRVSTKSVPIPCHSETRRDHDDYFHDDEERDGKGKISQLKAIEASIDRHNLQNMLTHLSDEKSTNKAEKDDLILYVSCSNIIPTIA